MQIKGRRTLKLFQQDLEAFLKTLNHTSPTEIRDFNVVGDA